MARRIWIDGDSVARPARRLVERHAGRRGYELIVVADRPIPLSDEENVSSVELESGAEAVDNHLLTHASPGELVVTRDIPLAEKLLERGVYVLNDRGEEFSEENIGRRKSERDMMQLLRESGAVASHGSSYGKADLKSFADSFDIFLTKRLH